MYIYRGALLVISYQSSRQYNRKTNSNSTSNTKHDRDTNKSQENMKKGHNIRKSEEKATERDRKKEATRRLNESKSTAEKLMVVVKCARRRYTQVIRRIYEIRLSAYRRPKALVTMFSFF